MKISETDLILNADGSVFHLGLHPDEVAELILAVGDPGRVNQVSRYFDTVEFKKNKREFITHTGVIGGKRLSVISTGIGPDNVEIFFSEIDALINVDLKTREPRERKRSVRIIRIGTSGSLQEDIPVGSHLISDYGVGLDNLMSFYNLPMDQIELEISDSLEEITGLPTKPYAVRGSDSLRQLVGQNMIVGNTVTCPGFYAPQGRTLRVPIRFPALLDHLQAFRYNNFRLATFEMETSAYFGMAKLLGHEAASVNAIIANRVTHDFSKNSPEVVDSLIQKVLEQI